MDTDFTEQNINEIEQNGFITNCGPNRSLYVVHDDVRKYCNYLNAVVNHTNPDDEYQCIHLNERYGDFIAICKPEYYEAAKDELDHYANIASKNSGLDRSW